MGIKLGENDRERQDYREHYKAAVNRMRATLRAASIFEPALAPEWAMLDQLVTDDVLFLLAAAADNDPLLRHAVQEALR